MNIEEDDLVYEEDIIRNPYSVKVWLRYIDHKKLSKPRALFSIYERSVNQLPYSYKLWYNYLKVLRLYCEKLPPWHELYEETNNTYERALTKMNKMPRIWIDYLIFLKDQRFTTRFRRTFNRSLLSLPSTQHKRICKVLFEFIDIHKETNHELCLRLFRRYMMLAPEDSEDFIDFLIAIKRYDEASEKLVEIINNDKFFSKRGKSKFELWLELCEIITKNPTEIHSVKVDAIIREGISRYQDQVGLLWNALADYYIRSNLFDKAISVYEEAMLNVKTIVDFKQVFNAYSEFFTESNKRKMELFMENTDNEKLSIEIDIDLANLEYLTERRALLLNNAMLKQNPMNIELWLERVDLLQDYGIEEQLKTLNDAIDTVGLKSKTVGRISQLWMRLAKLHFDNDNIAEARKVFEKACDQDFSKVEDLADLYCSFAEMELKLKQYDESIRILRDATVVPMSVGWKVNYNNVEYSAKERLHKSRRIWCFLVDLTVAMGTVEETQSVYNEIIELRIATPQIILNYAKYLEDRKYFEKSFSVYEKGVGLFKWPIVYDIWLNYLTKFVNYYKSDHFERSVELFESCLDNCPSEHCRKFYLLYAKFVEEHGMSKKALDIYKRTALAEKIEKRYDLFVLYIEKVKEFRGVMATREVYRLAIDNCNDIDTKKFCIQFADMEQQLGEIERARALYAFSAQFCDPRVTEKEFWEKWNEFEFKFGNRDTLADMQQIKRSVEARFNTHHSMTLGENGMDIADSMKQLDGEAGKPTLINYVSAGTVGGNISSEFTSAGITPANKSNVNPEAMDVDVESDEDEDNQEIDDEPEELPLPPELGITNVD